MREMIFWTLFGALAFVASFVAIFMATWASQEALEAWRRWRERRQARRPLAGLLRRMK